MDGRVLAAERGITRLNVLLGVIPGTAGVGHEYGQYETTGKTAGQQAEHAGNTHDETRSHGNHHGDERGNNHLTLSTLGGDTHAAGVVSLLAALEHVLVAQLAAYFFHHALGSATHGVHGQTAEQEGKHGTNEDTQQHLRVHERHVERGHELSDVHLGNLSAVEHSVAEVAGLEGLTVVDSGNLELLNVGGKKGKGGQSGGTDGEALTGSGGGVAQCVQSVRAAAHVITQSAHLGVTAGVVGNGTVGVRSQGQTQRGEHTHSGDTDAVEAHGHVICGESELTGSAEVGTDGTQNDEDNRPAGGNHTHADTGDDDGCRAGGGVLGNELHGLELEGGVVLRHLTDGDTHHETDDDGTPDAEPVVNAQHVEDTGGKNGDKHAGEVNALVQGSHELRLVGTGLGAHHEHAQNGKDSTHSADNHRSHDELQTLLVCPTGTGGCGSTQSGGSQNGTGVGLVQVSTHAGHVAHVVTHVVSNRSGVAGIVLIEVVLCLTHQVSAYVSGLGVDTAAHTGEESLQRGTHTEGQHDGGDGHQLVYTLTCHHPGAVVEQKIPTGNIQQTKAYHRQTQHGAGTESKLQTLVQTVLCVTAGLSHTTGSVGGRLHADETGKTGEETAGQEGDGYNLVLQAEVGHDAEDNGDDDEEDGNNLVLLLQVGHGAFAHVARNLLHAIRTLICLLHVEEELGRAGQNQQRGNGNDPE